MIYEARLAFTSQPQKKEQEEYRHNPFVRNTGRRGVGDGLSVYDYTKTFLYDESLGKSPIVRLNEDIERLEKQGYVAIKLEYFRSV